MASGFIMPSDVDDVGISQPTTSTPQKGQFDLEKIQKQYKVQSLLPKPEPTLQQKSEQNKAEGWGKIGEALNPFSSAGLDVGKRFQNLDAGVNKLGDNVFQGVANTPVMPNMPKATLGNYVPSTYNTAVKSLGDVWNSAGNVFQGIGNFADAGGKRMESDRLLGLSKDKNLTQEQRANYQRQAQDLLTSSGAKNDEGLRNTLEKGLFKGVTSAFGAATSPIAGAFDVLTDDGQKEWLGGAMGNVDSIADQALARVGLRPGSAEADTTKAGLMAALDLLGLKGAGAGVKGAKNAGLAGKLGDAINNGSSRFTNAAEDFATKYNVKTGAQAAADAFASFGKKTPPKAPTGFTAAGDPFFGYADDVVPPTGAPTGMPKGPTINPEMNPKMGSVKPSNVRPVVPLGMQDPMALAREALKGNTKDVVKKITGMFEKDTSDTFLGLERQIKTLTDQNTYSEVLNNIVQDSKSIRGGGEGKKIAQHIGEVVQKEADNVLDAQKTAGKAVGKTIEKFGNPTIDLTGQTKEFLGRVKQAGVKYANDPAAKQVITQVSNFLKEGDHSAKGIQSFRDSIRPLIPDATVKSYSYAERLVTDIDKMLKKSLNNIPGYARAAEEYATTLDAYNRFMKFLGEESAKIGNEGIAGLSAGEKAVRLLGNASSTTESILGNLFKVSTKYGSKTANFDDLLRLLESKSFLQDLYDVTPTASLDGIMKKTRGGGINNMPQTKVQLVGKGVDALGSLAQGDKAEILRRVVEGITGQKKMKPGSARLGELLKKDSKEKVINTKNTKSTTKKGFSTLSEALNAQQEQR